MDDVRPAETGEGHGRGEKGIGGTAGNVLVELGAHAFGVPSDGGHPVAAGGELVDDLAHITLDAGKGVRDHHMDDSKRLVPSRPHVRDSTRHGP
jgi:hypothetical protein